VYPLALTDPEKIPTNNTIDPHPLPDAASPSQLLSAAVGQLRSLSTSPSFRNNTCAQCQAGLQLAKLLTLSAPAQGPTFFVEFCSTFNLSPTCNVTYALSDTGSVITQVVASADVGGYDGQVSAVRSQFCITLMNCAGHLPKLFQHVPGAANSRARSRQLVCQIQAFSPSITEGSQWQASQSPAYFRPTLGSKSVV